MRSRPTIGRRALLGLSALALLGPTACGQSRPSSAPALTALLPSPTPVTPSTVPTPTTSTPAEAAQATGRGSSSPVIPILTPSGPSDDQATSLTGAGSTFAAVLYRRWFSEYAGLVGVRVSYQAVGSGEGIKSISDQTVDFGATDAPMTDAQLVAAKGGEILHVPMALGAVVATYNVPGVTAQLNFTPEALAGIYLGKVTTWNDPVLVQDNPSLAAIDHDISVAHRSDGSGTTFIFTDYLSHVSVPWQRSVGTGTSVRWPIGTGAVGSPGIATAVKQNEYSIGYVELIYALNNKIGVARVKNRAGRFIEPSLDAVIAAANTASNAIPADLRASIVDPPGDGAYPISGFTWQLVYRRMTSRPTAIAVSRLLWWEIHDGQAFAADLGYASLPPPVVRLAETKILSLDIPSR